MGSATTRRNSANRAGSRPGRRNRSHQISTGEKPHLSRWVEVENDLSRQPTLRLAAQRTNLFTRFNWPVFRAGAAILASLFICFMLTQVGVAKAIGDEMSSLGFDSERALFLQYVLMALVGGLVSGAVLRWRLTACLGGFLYFITGFFIPYISQALNPVTTVDGRPQLLNPGAFIQNSAALVSIGVIAAGAGAVLGQTCGDIIVAPLILLTRYVCARAKPQEAVRPSEILDLQRVAPAFALMVLLVTAIVLATSNIGDILNYGTSATIYQPVQETVAHGIVSTITYRSPA